MEKNELSRIPDSDAVVSPDNPDDPNDPVGTTDDPNDPATNIVVSPDDPNDPVVTTDDPNTCALVTNTLKEIRSTCAFVTNTLKEIRAEQEKIKFKGRNNNDLESSSSKHEKHQPNDIKIEITQSEEILGASLKYIHGPVPQCCIYKVPKHLRKINEEAYTPQVISIGPFHHGKPELRGMENQKSIYMLEFQKRVDEKKLMEFNMFIENQEQIIREFYQENFPLTSHMFVKMIFLDAVFIIEYFLKNAEPIQKRKFDFFLDKPYVRTAITHDLQLLENQLPYFLLKYLFEEGAFLNFTKEDYPNRRDRFLILCHRFFFNSENDDFPEPNDQIQHFTDLRRYFLLMDVLPGDQNQEVNVRDLPTATKLHGSGVKFKGIEGGSSHKISCELVPRHSCQLPIRIPYLTACELRIPCLEIDDWSECHYRNLMALELCHYPTETHICNFILLMNFLINTEKDVDLLVDQEIIFSSLGDNNTVATMFNSLGLQITPSPSVYHDICKKLKDHYAGGWNRTMATLNTVYFGDIWTGTATVAAFILLVLTFIQAVYSIL